MLLFVLGIGRVAFLSIGMKDVCLAVVQVLGRLNPFPVRTQRRGASASIRVFSCRFEFGLPPLIPPPRDDQYINLSPTESPAEDADMESGAVALPASQVECQESRKGLTRLPADTPRTPGSKSVDFQQFCDRLRTDLPGDSHGRGSFDTSARFVAGDPGARFGDSAPLEYEVTGESGHLHWKLIFEYILRQCGYLVDFHTVYIMVDNRELANHKRRDPSLPHWPAAARWWHSRLKLIGPHKEKTELFLFPISVSYWATPCAPHLGWHFRAGRTGGYVSWDQLRTAGYVKVRLLSLAKLRLEEVWKSFTEHTKRVDVWLKNDSEKGP